MQPQNQEIPGGREQLSAQPASNTERIPVLPTPEAGIETGADRREQVAESQAAATNMSAPTSSLPVVTLPTLPTVDPLTTPVAVGPLVAADEDVIEKEWVDKAKQILGETKDDPFLRSNRVNELQRDYLSKRYGKTLGAQPE